jgi:hypothetical protein
LIARTSAANLSYLPAANSLRAFLERLHAGEGPETLDRAEDVQQPGYGLLQLLDGPLLGTGQDQLDGGLLQAGPGIGPELTQAVVRHRVRHRDHLRDLSLRQLTFAQQPPQRHHLPFMGG